MSIFFYLIKSWMIGIAIAAPVGPIGMLCIRKTLELGFIGAVLVGLGAALADSVYGLVAALGLSAISHFLLAKAVMIKIIGGVFLLYLAYKEVKNLPRSKSTAIKSRASFALFAEVFFLTVTNPVTILSFIGIFASITGEPTSSIESSSMVLGIFLGSMTWWLILGGIITKIKHQLPEIWLHRIKYLSAAMLGGFGITAIITVLVEWGQ